MNYENNVKPGFKSVNTNTENLLRRGEEKISKERRGEKKAGDERRKE